MSGLHTLIGLETARQTDGREVKKPSRPVYAPEVMQDRGGYFYVARDGRSFVPTSLMQGLTPGN